MASKKSVSKPKKGLEPNSKYAKFDLDGDGIVSDDELARAEEMLRFENEDKREDAQRTMTWFALGGLLLYPALVVGCFLFSMEAAAKVLGDMAATYFVSVAGIVAAFFGAQAYAKK